MVESSDNNPKEVLNDLQKKYVDFREKEEKEKLEKEKSRKEKSRKEERKRRRKRKRM